MKAEKSNSILKEYKGYEYIAFEWTRELMHSLNGYVKIPEGHPVLASLNHRRWFDIGLSGWKFKKFIAKRENKEFSEAKPKARRRFRYDYDKVQIKVHGGLTFGQKITKSNQKDYLQGFTLGWWIGWDYAHLGDCFWDHTNPEVERLNLSSANHGEDQIDVFRTDHHWTLPEVEAECKEAIDQLIIMEKRVL